MTDNAISVFLSYSRKDAEVCEKLHSNLELQGLNVKIDVDDIPIGENIKDAIAQLITDSTCSVLVLSENSLQSIWVIWEIQRRAELANSKLIPVYIDKNYLDDEFVKMTHTQVQNHIEQLAKEAFEYSLKGTSSEHLDSKKQSLFNLKKNLSQLIDYIRSVNVVDLRKENYLAGFNALYQAITGKTRLENPSISLPDIPQPLSKNTDISSRIDEIAFLVSDENLKEAAKRLIDFIKDFYPKNTEYLKMAIKISARVCSGEKNLAKGNDLMLHNEKLVSEILDFIFLPLAEAA